MTRSELEAKSRKQLLAIAGHAAISGRRGLSKAELIEAILSASPHVLSPEGPAELPSSYGRTRLRLVEIEPHWIHAYWEITALDCEVAIAAAGPEAGETTWVLRFYDVTDVEFEGANARDSFDVPVDVAAGNWYVNLWSGGKTYCAEIGLRAPSGLFVPVSRSGVVQVPAASAAPRAEAEWMKVEPATGKTAPAEEPAHEEAPAPVATVASEAGEPQLAIVEPVLLPAAEQPVTAVVVSQSVRAAVPEAFPLPPPLPTVTRTEMATVSPNATATDRWCEEVLSPQESNGNGNGHAATTGSQSATERETTPSSHSVDRFGSTSDGLGAAAVERAPSIKLELNAEVVIYGRAMPGQTVEVCGRTVKVNPDGTFSVRMALPLAGDDAARSQ